jgi:CHAD domain-containing protein
VAYRIKRREGVAEAVRRIVREQLRGAIAVARDGTIAQDERVHEVRTRLKRSRAALSLIRREVGAAAARDDRRLRDAARLLSRSRDLAVQAQTFRALGARAQSGLPRRLLARLGATEQELRRALDPDDVERQLREAARALSRLRRELGAWGVSGGRRVVGTGVTTTYRLGLETLAAARARPSPERFHDWRKQVKALSYELRIIGGAVPELTTTLIPKIEKLADILGQIHDLDGAKAAAEKHPRWFGRPADGQSVLGAVEERRAELETESLRLAASVFAGRARDVRALVEIGWEIWRKGPGPTVAPAQVSASDPLATG